MQGGTGTTRHLDGLLDALKFGASERPRLVHRLDRDTSGVFLLARNAGAAAARGDVFAYTDSDCMPDPDWLYYLVGDLLHSKYAGMGGHNFLPPEDSWVAASVMASGPSQYQTMWAMGK